MTNEPNDEMADTVRDPDAAPDTVPTEVLEREMPLRCQVMFLMAGDNPTDEEAAFWNDWKDRSKEDGWDC